MATQTVDSMIEPVRCSAVLTHHWLTRRRGGERVLEALGELLPESPIYTLVHDRAGLGDWPLSERAIHETWLGRIPGARRHYPKLLPLMPLAARQTRLPEVDLVVCSDAAVAKVLRPAQRSKVVCYCHSPMRYVYEPTIRAEYARTLPALLRPLWGPVTACVRRADYRAAQRVDQFVANSAHVAERIQRCYGRDAVVVHPPVDLPDAPATGPREDFLLCVGYHVAYKRLDLAVAASAKLRRQLVVIGSGPEMQRLQRQSPGNVRWLGWQSTESIVDHYRQAAALLFPGEEDFGIVPVEAIAHGCPVVAYGVGGATESVVDGETGVLFEEQTVASLATAIERLGQLDFDPQRMHAHAQQFSKARFIEQMRTVLLGVLEGNVNK